MEFQGRDIWADDQARRFVRTHNRGNETVPTVVVGDWVATNPSTGAVLDVLRQRGLLEPGTGAPRRRWWRP